MRKYFVRYLIFWLPAAIASYFLHYSGGIFQVAQWLCAFFMVFGWAVNTGMAAYEYPRNTLSLLLAYTGMSILIITALYSSPYASPAYRWLSLLGGLFSFRPLDVMVMAILDFNIQHELYVIGSLAGLCAVGYLTGVLYRHIRPNPYQPKIYRF